MLRIDNAVDADARLLARLGRLGKVDIARTVHLNSLEAQFLDQVEPVFNRSIRHLDHRVLDGLLQTSLRFGRHELSLPGRSQANRRKTRACKLQKLPSIEVKAIHSCSSAKQVFDRRSAVRLYRIFAAEHGVHGCRPVGTCRNPVGRVLGNGRFYNLGEVALPAGGFPLLEFAEVASTSAPNFVGPTAGHATSARQAWPSCSRRRAEPTGYRDKALAPCSFCGEVSIVTTWAVSPAPSNACAALRLFVSAAAAAVEKRRG